MPIIDDPRILPPSPPEVIVSPDGVLTASLDLAHSGVLLRADFSGLDPWPTKVRFLRDGVPILSGNPAWAPEGKATAYDYFAPMSRTSVYTAVPDGGVSSLSAGIRLPKIPHSNFKNVWAKSAARPVQSMLLTSVGEKPSFGREGRTNLQAIPGSALRGGTSDIQLGWTTTLTFLTQTLAEQTQLEILLTSGAFLLQWMVEFHLQDMWVEPGTLSMVPHARMDAGAQIWTVEVTQIGAPSTVDSPLYIPGRSWAEVGAEWTWDELGSIFTWHSLLEPA